ncbi:Flp family type IVb pilin [Nocardioides houyundeii]|uniref:Flp family type IVb pilin n=1 Tax=Nocardioides houyundeii TaxID=2045452 RepID=UPI000C78801B|nr:Flp family type IVb pilin [Nocardioides houyundeii]
MRTYYTARDRGRRRTSEQGASSVEYGLLIAGIAALIVLSVFMFGGAVADLFGGSCETMNASTHTGSC